MRVVAALLLCLTVQGTFAKNCPNSVTCSCGIEGGNVTVCAPDSLHAEVCNRLSKCEECKDGYDSCTKCPEGLKGPTCSLAIRKKRQGIATPSDAELQDALKSLFAKNSDDKCSVDGLKNSTPEKTGCFRLTAGRMCDVTCEDGYYFEGTDEEKRMTFSCKDGVWTPGTSVPNCIKGDDAEEIKECPDAKLPQFGVSSCNNEGKRKTCTATCFDGYYFEGTDKDKEMTLRCRGGVWSPRTSFPLCIATGECDYHQPAAGRSNCTSDSVHTYCDVWCDHKYRGRYNCYPGKPWEPRLPLCLTPNTAFKWHGVYCDHPGRIPNSKMQYFAPGNSDPELYEIEKFSEGSVVEYSCEDGFQIREGSRRLRCEASGSWSEVLPTCVPVPKKTECADPGFVENGLRRNIDGSESTTNDVYEEGQSVIYSCTSNDFALRGYSFLRCQQDGSWSRPLPTCQISQDSERYCQDPGVDVNGSREPKSPSSPRGFTAGSRLEYSCNQGYDLRGEWSSVCLMSGEWTASRPTCERRKSNAELDYCENPGVLSNGQVLYYPTSGNRRLLSVMDESEFPEGSRLEYSCNPGYSLLGQKTLICEKPGLWSEDPPFCRRDTSRRRYCVHPGSVANGRVELVQNQAIRRTSNRDEYPEGSRLRYICDDGYTPDGPATLTCKRTGSWSPAVPPMCINANDDDRVTCQNPGSVLNGRLRYLPPGIRNGIGVRLVTEMDEYPEGSTLEYVCEKGFWLQGSHSLVCDSTGFWSAERPTCVPDCGRPYAESSVRVRNGQETLTGVWPWVVSISLQVDNRAIFVCSGAVFTSRAVVTAAHCLEEGSTYILRFGKHHFKIEDDDSQVLNRTSNQVIIHPDYSTRTMDSDIGLILFETPIEYSTRVQPICMPTIETTIKNIKPGTVGYVSGWGDTERDLRAKTLLFAGLPVISKKSCDESYTRQNLTFSITGNMFCAGYYNRTYSVCEGDSGSPFVFYDNLSQRYTMEGLVSFVVRKPQDAQVCGLPGRYAIFTRVIRFVPWLYESVQ